MNTNKTQMNLFVLLLLAIAVGLCLIPLEGQSDYYSIATDTAIPADTVTQILAASPRHPRMQVNASGTLVGDDNPLPVKIMSEIASITLELGDLTVDAIPSFQTSAGTATRALVDEEDRAVVSIGAETIGVVTAIENGDAITGFAAGVLTVSAETGAAVKMPDLGTARTVYIFSDQDVNFGGSGIGAGDAEPYIPGGAPFVKFRFTTNEPDFYFRGRSVTASIRIWAAEE